MRVLLIAPEEVARKPKLNIQNQASDKNNFSIL